MKKLFLFGFVFVFLSCSNSNPEKELALQKEQLRQEKIDSLKHLISETSNLIKKIRSGIEEDFAESDSLHKAGRSAEALMILDAVSPLAKQSDRLAKKLVEHRRQLDWLEMQ